MPSAPETETPGECGSESAPALQLVDAHYAYQGRFPALSGVSLSVAAGESVALVGPNGGGKSTLLKILDGLVFPDAGELWAFGQLIAEDTLEDRQLNEGFRSRVGFVFQNSDAQVFSPTVREEVAFGPLNLGWDRDTVAARVADVLALLEIAELSDRAPYQLSGGQKKRVAIGSVLVMNPEVLLFDEPTAALDPRTQDWVIDLLGHLRGAGKTVVVATHDRRALARVADRIVEVGEDHRVVFDGPRRDWPAGDHFLRA